MDLDEGGLRYSDNKYFDPFSSDDEASEDDIFEGRCDEQTYVPCPLEEAGRTRTVHQSAELSQSIATAEDIENVAAEQVGGSEERIHKEFPQFNGKDLAMLTMNDMKGVYFPTLDAAEELYALHSKLVGFSVRKDRLETDVNGLGIRRQWVCSKQGEAVSQRRQRKKGVCGNKTGKENTSALPKKHKRNIVPRGRRYTRVNCPASFSVHYCPERQSYYVHRFLHEHNHDLALSAEVQFLRSHRCVQPHQLAQADVLRELEVHTSKVYEHLVEQAGGHEAVGFTLKDLYNRLADKRRSAEIEGDAQSALTWMNMRGVESDQFFCRYQKDEEGRLAHLFWRDAQSLLDYQVYGDVLIMDSTYKTNMYGKPLVVFVGSNNHRATIVFGFALVADEKEDTYRWVFEKFLESMNQKQPSAILTDQDEAIRNAVQLLMPDSKHRLCAWHIGRNIGQNVKDPEAQKSIGQMIYASLTPREWEVAWHSLVARHGLSDNGWVSSLYMKRERWAEAFFRGHFYGGMCSTQRVKCFHSKLKRDVGRYKRMCEVLPMSERTLARIRNRVLYDNFRAKNSAPVYETHMRGIEEEACREFTHDIFVMIKAQILFEKKFVVAHKQSFPLSDSVMFYLTQYERPGRHWSVEFVSDPVHPKWLCSCKSFESDGIPCCHIFCVLKAQLVSHFPKTLIRERWTKKAGEMTLAPLTRRTSNFKSAQVARYSALMLEASKVCLNYSYSEEGLTSAIAELAKLHQASIRFIRVAENDTVRVPPTDNVLLDPKVSRTKGAPSNSQQNRQEGKQTYVCKNCGIPGHNRRSCKNPPRTQPESRTHATPPLEAHQTPFFRDSQQSTSTRVDRAAINLNQPFTTDVDMHLSLSNDSLPPYNFHPSQ